MKCDEAGIIIMIADQPLGVQMWSDVQAQQHVVGLDEGQPKSFVSQLGW